MKQLQIDGQALDELLHEMREKHEVIGATLAVLKRGRIYSAGSGVLNLDTGVECTADSVFQIGSIGKAFTATLIMQLVDEGRMRLNDPVVTYMPDFLVANPKVARAVTVRQLLNHTSGMDSDLFPPDDPEGPSTRSYIQKMHLLPSLFLPGKGPMTYCNSGFVVAGRLIEVITGMTWQNAVIEKICKPLGLPAAFAHPHEALRYRCAMGHMPDPQDPGKLITAPVTFLPISVAAAGAVLSMSAESVLRFAQAHMANGNYGDKQRLLSAKSARAMRQDKTPVLPFSRGDVNQWGLGWMLGDYPKYQMVGHDGVTFGQFTYLRSFPDKKLAFALLTNSPSMPLFNELNGRLMNLLLGVAPAPEPARRKFQLEIKRHVGCYSNIASEQWVEKKGKALSVRLVDKLWGMPDRVSKLKPYRRDVFEMETSDTLLSDSMLTFVGKDENGRAQFARMGMRMARRQP